MARLVKKVRVTRRQVEEHRERIKKDLSPSWDSASEWDTNTFYNTFRKSLDYYNSKYTGKDLKPEVISWMKSNGYESEVIAHFESIESWHSSITMGAIAACLNRGMPEYRDDFNNGKNSAEWLRNAIADVLNRNIIEEPSDTSIQNQKSIQDRTRQIAEKMVSEIDMAIDDWIRSPETADLSNYNLLNILRGKNAKPAHSRLIKEFYLSSYVELQELTSGSADAQLRECYSSRPRKYIRALLQFYSEIMNACDLLAIEGKANRNQTPRVKKAVSKDKLVSKLKYKLIDDTYNIVSINTIDIIGAQSLWVFDTKTRKLGQYVASDKIGLSVRGTSIIGFDPDKSIQKTLRKPVEILPTIKAANKAALRVLLDDISTTDIKLTGRISETVVILRAI